MFALACARVFSAGLIQSKIYTLVNLNSYEKNFPDFTEVHYQVQKDPPLWRVLIQLNQVLS